MRIEITPRLLTGSLEIPPSKSVSHRAIISAGLAKGESVTLVGFGTFSVGERAARVGRNPQTGAEIQIAASKQPKFSAGSKLKDAVN